MSVNTGNKPAGHVKRAEPVVLAATGRAETAFAAEGNELEISTMSAAEHGTAVGRIAAMNHLVNIFDYRRTGMKFINDMFIIVGKNGL